MKQVTAAFVNLTLNGFLLRSLTLRIALLCPAETRDRDLRHLLP